MVLFSIACETCASRLNVKQQAAIGQVLACPKCGSMVHVRPPEGWQPPESEHPRSNTPRPPRNANDSQATLSGEFGNLDRSRSALPSVAKPKAARRAAVSAESPSPNISASAKAPVSAKAPASAKAPVVNTQQASAPPVQEAVDISLPANNWEADGSSHRSSAKAWIAGIIGICVIAGVLILYMVNSLIGDSDNSGESSDKQANVVETDSDKKVDVVNVVDDETGSEKAKNNEKVDEPIDPAPGVGETKDDSENKTPEADPNAVTNPPDESTNPVPPIDQTNDSPPDDSPTKPKDSVLKEDAALQPSDPLTMDKGEQQESIVDDFGDMGDLVFESSIDMEVFRENTSEDQTRKLGIGEVFVPVPKPISIDPKKAATEPFPGMAFKDQTLLVFTRNLFQITQVPIQLDGQAIVDRLLDPFANIETAGKNISAQQILSQALGPLNLKWKWNEDNSVIVIVPKLDNEIVQTELAIDPVLAISDEESVTMLSNEIQNVINPAAWTANKGLGSLEIVGDKLILQQDPTTTRRVEVLLEKLALAARLKANPDDVDVSEQLASLYSRNKDLMGSVGTYEAVQRQAIQKLLGELDQQDGLMVIVNWAEVSEEQWNPKVRIPWLSEIQDEKLTLGTTLRNLTTSMNLAYRYVDKGVVEVTSKTTFRNATRVEVYPCHRQLKKYTANQVIQILKEGVAADLPKTEYTRVDYLPQYNCIVALLPEPLHIRAEKILDQLAGE